MSSSTLRNFNSTKIPLLANQAFFGKYEFTGAMLSGIVNCYASTNINVTIIQNPGNVDTTLDVIISSTNIPPYTLKTIDFNLALPYTKVIVVNLDAINQLQLDINAIYTNLEYTSSIPTTITGNVAITNIVDVDVINDVSCNILNDSLTTLETATYKPVYNGITDDYEFTPTAINNSSYYYADETKGTDVATGWQFTSTSLGGSNTKINWYLYSPTTNVTITDLSSPSATNSYYTVIENVGVQYPFMILYTRVSSPINKNTGGAAGSSWYQSKLFYQAQVAGMVGQYLLYVGADPVAVRPDLTHIKLVKLDALCAGTQLPDELLLSASLQTSSNIESPAGDFSFTMNKFGVIIPSSVATLKTDLVGNLYVNETNSTTISTTLSTLNSKVTTCNTNAVVISSIVNPVIVKDKPTYSFDVGNAGTTSTTIRSSAGVLAGIYLTHRGGSQFCFAKFYNASTAVAGDIPLATFGIYKDSQIYIDTKNMNFSGGLCVRGTDNYGVADNTNPSGTIDVVAFLSAYSE
jgi:hypothetical protein